MGGEGIQGERQTNGCRNDQRHEQDNTGARHAPSRECKSIDGHDQDKSGRERNRNQDGGAAQQQTESETLLKLFKIGVELVPRAHGSSLSFPKYWLASQDSAIAAASTSNMMYHHRLYGFDPSGTGTPRISLSGPAAFPRQSDIMSSGITSRSDSRRSALTPITSWRPSARRNS